MEKTCGQIADEAIDALLALVDCGYEERMRLPLQIVRHIRAEMNIEEDYEPEPDINDTVNCCPECETPNQFGEVCLRCEHEIGEEAGL